MKGIIAVSRRSAREFIAEWFGFDYRKIHISMFQTDADGSCISIQFRVHSYARMRYLARRRNGDAEWELIPLP